MTSTEPELVEFNLPPTARVLFNSLYRGIDYDQIDQDVTAIAMPDKIFLDVGWYGDRQSGGFTVAAFREYWDHQLEKVQTRDVDEVKRAIEDMAARYAAPSSCKSP